MKTRVVGVVMVLVLGLAWFCCWFSPESVAYDCPLGCDDWGCVQLRCIKFVGEPQSTKPCFLASEEICKESGLWYCDSTAYGNTGDTCIEDPYMGLVDVWGCDECDPHCSDQDPSAADGCDSYECEDNYIGPRPNRFCIIQNSP